MTKRALIILSLVAATMAGCHGELVGITSFDQFKIELDRDGQRLFALYFTASWDTQCWALEPLIIEYSESTLVFRLDVDQFPDAAEEFEVAFMPTMILVRNKSMVEILEGPDKIRDYMLPRKSTWENRSQGSYSSLSFRCAPG